jgi:Tfp pilus assembly protein PilN
VGADKPSEMRAVNLLPPDLRSGPKGSAPAVSSGVENSGPGAFVVLGVLAFCVAALATYVLAGNTVKDREAELAAATAKSAAVSQQVAALKPYADFESVANTRVQTVTDLANSRFDWEQALRDLSRAVPADVTIGTLKGTLGSTDAANPADAAAPSISLAGCTYSQTKVAELMARLRNIDGVAKVLLTKSDKEATTGAGGGDRNAPSASGYCGKADIPAFELEVVFKAAPGATAATGATAGTPPTTTSAPAASATPAPAAGAAATPAPAAGAAPAATAAPASASATPAPTTP